MLTDEAFILLSGNAALIAAKIEGEKIKYEVINMQAGLIYNIPVNMWHKIAMQPGSSVLIVEDSNTHVGDFEFYDLSPEQKQQLRQAVEAAINRD